MADHLRFAGANNAAQCEALRTLVLSSPLLGSVLERARDLDLPDWWVVSGALYNTVWNALTGRSLNNGIKDVDLFYWDGTNLSYEAEDAVIKRGAEIFSGLPLPVEIRNQARVHLWYQDHFGTPYAPLQSSCEAIDRFASKTHSVGVRLGGDGTLSIYAPFGLDDLFSFRITPNRCSDNRTTHETKGRRAMSVWPEITVEPW
ncbi:MAG TPA: nucleotidyltransferase family protein [Devosia sp.]|uniref:nucleotidyltransferase family protein n=1 Tax=Devosia sp. TaxID=1871048 RepID=UPI002F94231A